MTARAIGWSGLVIAALVFGLGWFIASPRSDGSRFAAAERAGAQTVPSPRGRLRAFAYREMRRQSARTCRFVPRKVLARAFARASIDPELAGAPPAEATDDYLALWYAENVRIHPIRLQQAAYDGCLAGLAARR